MMHVPLIFGTVTDTKPGYAKVRLDAYDGAGTDWLQVVKPRAMGDDMNWPLKVGEQVVCLFTDWLKTGVVLGATSNDEDTPDEGAGVKKFRMKFEDGAYIEYDKESHAYTISVTGDGAKVEVKQGGATLRLAGGKLRFTNGSGSLKTGIDNLITHITQLTVPTAVGPSGVPINSAAFVSDKTYIDNLLD